MTAPATQAASPPAEPRLYRIPEAMRLLALSRSEIYVQLRERRLRSVHQGRARLIPSTAIAEYIALLEREEAERDEAA